MHTYLMRLESFCWVCTTAVRHPVWWFPKKAFRSFACFRRNSCVESTHVDPVSLWCQPGARITFRDLRRALSTPPVIMAAEDPTTNAFSFLFLSSDKSQASSGFLAASLLPPTTTDAAFPVRFLPLAASAVHSNEIAASSLFSD